MITDKDAQKCMGFLEVVRTMIDNAELDIAAATVEKQCGHCLSKASSQIQVAAMNLKWVAEEIIRISEEKLRGLLNASAADGVATGSTVEPEQKTGSNKLPV